MVLSDYSYSGSRRAVVSDRGESLYARAAGAPRWRIIAVSCEMQRAAELLIESWKQSQARASEESHRSG